MVSVTGSTMQSVKKVTLSSTTSAYLLGLLGVVIFGATLPATTIALSDFDPWFLTFSRALLASIAAIAWLAITRKAMATPENIRLFVVGLLLIFGFPGFMALALQTVPASHGGVVLGFLPLATAIGARVIAGEAPSARFWFLSLLGACIVAAYAYFERADGEEPGISTGDSWLFLACACAATGYVISGKLSKTMPGHEVICRALVLNLPLIAIGTFWFWQPAYASPSWPGTIGLLYLGLFFMFFGFFAWNTALALGGIARIGQLQLLQIFVTIALSALLLDERISLVTLATACAVSAIIALTRKS